MVVADFDAWVHAYESAWRAAGTEALGDLFTTEATYRMSPFEDPVVGLERIADLWEREREGPDEPFEIEYERVAAEGDTAVFRVEVRYGRSGNRYRDLWIVRFAEDGRCREFEEWPFWPGQPINPGGE